MYGLFRRALDSINEKPKRRKNNPFLHGVLRFRIEKAEQLDIPGYTDFKEIYVKVSLGDAVLGQTRAVKCDKNPEWHESFRRDIAHDAKGLRIQVLCGDGEDDDERLGVVKLSCKDMIAKPTDPTSWTLSKLADQPKHRKQNWFPLADGSGRRNNADIKITISFEPVGSLYKDVPAAPTGSAGVGAGATADAGSNVAASMRLDVKDAYFSSHKANKVTLYQDAETPHMALFDDIKYADGTSYEPTNCWKDLYHVITHAKKFIYLTGWSVWDHVVLVRDGKHEEITLGKLLKRKAEEGVTVLGMVWDEKLFGLVGTHDEETRDYFDDTKVRMLVVPRAKQQLDLSRIKENIILSHHQKAIVCDADHPTEKHKHRLVAFVGGLDVTLGRYDNHSHPLYATLRGVHKHDFYQSCLSGATVEEGPRLPWHDAHSQIEGPAAYDVVRNFEERWKKQAPMDQKEELLNLHNGHFDLACPGPCEESQMWQCQVFRSITDESAHFKHDLLDKLTNNEDVMYDDSIQRCYVQQIRQAQKFLYMENQYFVGSSYAWDADTETASNNVVPMEIASKIVEKIHARERFAAYIVIPMYPEGNEISKRDILHWQHRTVEMMYKRIARAIKQTKTEAKPTDYLNFYCLGTREKKQVSEKLEHPSDPMLKKLRDTRRFQVYVHAKMMIVDDTYVIVGSANINQRSMDGKRDTEIAIGAYQNNYVYSDGTFPQGKVHGFRKALWAEHSGAVDSNFDDPSGIECVKKINKIAKNNWDIYVDKDTENTQGHLLKYPYKVKDDGTVNAHRDEFPDTDTPVIGHKFCLFGLESITG